MVQWYILSWRFMKAVSGYARRTISSLTYTTKTSSDIVPYRLQEVSRLWGLPELDCENSLQRWHVLHIRRHRCVETIGSEGSY
jgi:hypothetical protein